MENEVKLDFLIIADIADTLIRPWVGQSDNSYPSLKGNDAGKIALIKTNLSLKVQSCDGEEQ